MVGPENLAFSMIGSNPTPAANFYHYLQRFIKIITKPIRLIYNKGVKNNV